MKRTGLLLGCLGVCGLALVLRSTIAAIPLERDEGAYAAIAQRWLHGEIPYQAYFDHKPPGVLAAYRAILAAFGETASPAAIHGATQVYSLVTLGVLFGLGRRLFSERAGLLAAALGAILLADASVLGNESNSEIFQILPQTAALWATLVAGERRSPRRAFLAGVLLGAAVLFKQTAIALAVPALVFVWWRGARRVPPVLALVAGALAPVALTVGYFAAHGAAGALYECTVAYNRTYASVVPLSAYPAALAVSLRALAASAWPVLVLAIYALAAIARGGVAAVKSHVLLAGWTAFSLLSVGAGGRFFPHYWVVMVPPLALLAASAVERLPRASMAAWGAVAVAAIAAWAVNPWYYSPAMSPEEKVWRLYGLNPFAESQAVAAFVAEHSSPEDRVLVLGAEPQILYYADRRSASRFVYLYPLGLPGPQSQSWQQAVVGEITRDPPRLIVTELAPRWWEVERPQALLDGVATALSTSYRVIALLPGNRRGPAALRTGTEAVGLWERYPYWFEGATPWSLAVWERVR
jgi:Dolichyl-phosphate-mannose-protein mannosyltransferase